MNCEDQCKDRQQDDVCDAIDYSHCQVPRNTKPIGESNEVTIPVHLASHQEAAEWGGNHEGTQRDLQVEGYQKLKFINLWTNA